MFVHTEKMTWSKHHVELIIVSEMLFLGKKKKKKYHTFSFSSVSLCRLASIAVPLGVSPDCAVMLQLRLCFDFERSGCMQSPFLVKLKCH